MTYDRRVSAYTTATALDQTTLDETFRGGETEICTVGTLIKTVGATTYTLRFSDRSKYVGDTFYYGRAKFPNIKRTVGELVAPTLQFSEMEVQLNNVDGFYNQYLVNGANYFSFIGAQLIIQVGLRDVANTYFTMFDGFVPDEDGFSVSRESITIRARDRADALNKSTGLPYINETDYPTAPTQSYGKVIPLVLGDWTIGYNVIVNFGPTKIQSGPNQYDVWCDAPSDFYGGIIGYNVGQGFFVFSVGNYTPDTIANCHIKRGNLLIQVNFDSTPQDAAGYWVVEVLGYNLVGGGTIPYVFVDGDQASISVKIPYAVGEYSNSVRQAKEILKTIGGVAEGDFDAASWNALMAKSTPAQSSIVDIKSRVWIGKEDDKILEYTLSLLEQVRIELYWDSAQKIALRSIHPEDFKDQGSFRIEQIYIDEESIKVTSDQRNFFNISLANYAYTPLLDKTQLQTKKRKNQNSVDKIGKEVTKVIDLPSLYIESDALNQIDEFIRFYSSSQEYVECGVNWTVMLNDLTAIIVFNYNVGSIVFNAKPMKIRDINFIPENGCLTLKLLSFANFPHDGYAPSNAGKMLSSQSQTLIDA